MVKPKENDRFAELRPWGVGLARLRVDGWGYFQRERDAREGRLTTIPFEYQGGSLVVNGVGLTSDAIGIEVRTADNAAVVAGFESDACSFSEPDSVRGVVTWQSGNALQPGRYRLRFTVRGLETKLYAFGFE